ncbi:DUF2971 domain-containing protein [Methylolobus aquaticus]|nr:DUF2971 domain-containing protein [Methylolobus aquaticus]
MTRKIRLAVLSASAAQSRGVLRLQDDNSTCIISGYGGKNSPDYICGYCGSILAKKHDLKLLANAATICNVCQEYNDLCRPAKFQEPPVTIRTIAKNQAQKKAFRDSPLKQGPIHNKDLALLRESLQESWMKYQGERPEILYHYTSYAGLHGILKSHSIWATDCEYLNDPSEGHVAISLIESYIDSIKGVSSHCQCLLKSIRDRLEHYKPDAAPFSYFIACFCTSGDLLSQWRAYGASASGYALGFSAEDFGGYGRMDVRRIIYDGETQGALIKGAIDGACDALDMTIKHTLPDQQDPQDIITQFSNFLSDHLHQFMLTFKHRSFAEENEWRIVIPFSRDTDTDLLRFRSANGLPVPYIESDLGKRNGPKGIMLPLVEIVHGPTLHSELTKKSLHLMLQAYGYDHVDVSGSESPLRT